jgi:hypothetical protein
MAIEAVHRLATENSPQIRYILENVVFLLVPSLNPDGQILVTDWYNKTVGTTNEGAPLPWLYQRYAGHDNNRDAYMFTQKETRLAGKILYRDWLPEIWLDVHQLGMSGPRIFVMPAMDPINPNVDTLIYRTAGLLGFAQAAALERAGKPGIIYGDTYTYWWEGAMAWAGWWHNMVGMLIEVASARLATTIEQERVEPDRQPAAASQEQSGRGIQQDDGRTLAPPSDVQSRISYPKPWLGGLWSLRDIVDYELLATFGLLETGAGLRAQLLEGLYRVGKRQIELGSKGDPFAVVIPEAQGDPPTVLKLLQTLAYGGVEVHRARQSFEADGTRYPAGTFVLLMAQPFRAYVKDMLEPQVYPKILPAPGMPPRPPYDIAGWSLGMQMGVEAIFVKKPFQADLEKMDSFPTPAGRITGQGPVFVLGHETDNSLIAVNRLLKARQEVSWLMNPVTVQGRSFGPGAVVVQGGAGLRALIAEITTTLGIDAVACDQPAGRSIPIRAPRTALYQPWGGNTDEGWTRWLLEQYEFPFTTIHPEDVRRGDLAMNYDAIILPDISLTLLTSGLTAKNVPEEYRGGIEAAGVEALRTFIEVGGSLIALGQSSALAIEKFAAPYRDSVRSLKREDFFCPGSVLRVLVDNTHPIGYGMKEDAAACFVNSLALEPVPSFTKMRPTVVVRYPGSDILKSGWLHGESYLANKVAVAEVRLGKGRMVLLPLRVQHRAQTHGTFKLLFNSVLTSSPGINPE